MSENKSEFNGLTLFRDPPPPLWIRATYVIPVRNTGIQEPKPLSIWVKTIEKSIAKRIDLTHKNTVNRNIFALPKFARMLMRVY